MCIYKKIYICVSVCVRAPCKRGCRCAKSKENNVLKRLCEIKFSV